MLYLCSAAEKMSAPFTLARPRSQRARVDAGDRRQRARQGGAADRAARRLQARAARSGPETSAFLEALTGEQPTGVEEALERARAIHPLAADLVEPLLSLTLSPTMVEASQKRNVIPARCDVTVDCRLLPGQLPADVEPIIREVLGEGSYELEWIEA